jgi:ubiquinone/menaquinone biosynthesis C-methylase UbiE
VTARDAGGFFDAQAAWYDREYDEETASGRVLRSRMQAVLGVLGREPGSVVDAGMGGGRLCAELDRLGWAVTGVDPSAEMVALARRRLPHLASRLLEGRIETLPLDDACMDAAIATGVLEYVDDLDLAVRELARVLRPGGVAAVSIPAPRGPNTFWRLRVLYPFVRFAKRVVPFGRPSPPARPRRSSSALETALAAAGLTVETVVRVGARPNPGWLGARQLVYGARKSG